MKLRTSDVHLDSPLSEIFNPNSLRIQELAHHGVKTILDLIWILPKKPRPLSEYSSQDKGDFYTKVFIDKVSQNSRFSRGRLTIFVQGHDQDQKVKVTYFNSFYNLYKKIKNSEKLIFLGPVKEDSLLTFINPKIIESESPASLLIYPKIGDVPSSVIKKLIQALPESLWSQKKKFAFNYLYEDIDTIATLYKIHQGIEEQDTTFFDKLVQTEEATKLYINLKQVERLKSDIPRLHFRKDFIIKSMEHCPFKLTNDQQIALKEVLIDLSGNKQMQRVLQGDVGSGKTIVSFLALVGLSLANPKIQVCFMAPTTILIKQHYDNFKKYFKNLNLKTALLTSDAKLAQKYECLKKIRSGNIQILFATHAATQKDIIFNNLKFCIIDEQHRFGVDQRRNLVKKGNNPHLLLMSATPIPRTLQSILYRGVSFSSIKQMPNHRDVVTRIIPFKKTQEISKILLETTKSNNQVFIVSPSIGEDDQEHSLGHYFRIISELLPESTIEVLHGQMTMDEKQKIINDFTKGKTNVLLSTTIIEVGFDNPNANTILIIDPQNFGLSTLHQLRGRVGRGGQKGICLLSPTKMLNDEQLDRLNYFCSENDGFKLSQKDLDNRGMGEIFNNLQTGHTYSIQIEILEEVAVRIEKLDCESQVLIKNKYRSKNVHIDSLV